MNVARRAGPACGIMSHLAHLVTVCPPCRRRCRRSHHHLPPLRLRAFQRSPATVALLIVLGGVMTFGVVVLGVIA